MKTEQAEQRVNVDHDAGMGLGWLRPRGIVAILCLYSLGIVLYGVIAWRWLDSDSAGNFGDMFGAFSAFVSGLSSIGVVIAILLQFKQMMMQQDALEIQRQELRLQRSELAGNRQELEKQVYLAALAARVNALANLSEYGQADLELYQTNLTLKHYLDALIPQSLRNLPEGSGAPSASPDKDVKFHGEE